MKEKSDESDFIKIKSFCFSKNAIRKKIVIVHISGKWLYKRQILTKELLPLNLRQTTKKKKKKGPEIWTCASHTKEDI